SMLPHAAARQPSPTGETLFPVGIGVSLFYWRNTMTSIDETTISDTELETEFDPSVFVTATPVPEAERMQFLPRFFGRRYMLLGESLVYSWMHQLAPDYHGGFWDFYTLSNDAYY